MIREYPGPPSAGYTFYYAVSGLSGLMVIAVSHRSFIKMIDNLYFII